jgi:hypothetical protein
MHIKAPASFHATLVWRRLRHLPIHSTRLQNSRVNFAKKLAGSSVGANHLRPQRDSMAQTAVA